MKVYWTESAETDRSEIMDHIAEDNPGAALDMDNLFVDTASRLAHHPFMGKPGVIPGTREFTPHPSYRLVYELDQDAVFILNLVHTAQLWP